MSLPLFCCEEIIGLLIAKQQELLLDVGIGSGVNTNSKLLSLQFEAVVV
jgi:hypothetical protein